MNKTFLDLCQSGSFEEVKEALIAGVDPEETDQIDRTGLMLAVLYNPDIMVSRLLIESGFNVNHIDGSDMSALHYAVEYSLDRSFITMLLEAGADVDNTSNYNRSVLMSAAAFNHESVELLLAAGANPNLVDEQGLDAVMYNIWFSYDQAVIECLFKAGSNQNHRDNFDRDWQDYVRICEPLFLFSGMPDLKPMRIDLEPALVLSEEQSKRMVSFGASPAGEPFWLEEIKVNSEYIIHYYIDKEESLVSVKGLPPDVNHCVPFHFPFSWFLAISREEYLDSDYDAPSLFLIDSSGNILHQYVAGYSIGDIIPENESFLIRYEDDPLYGLASDPLVRLNMDGTIIDKIDCKNDGTDETANMCVAVCKHDDSIYAMFEPGMYLMKIEEDGLESFIETHQSFSAMAFNENGCLMKEHLKIDNQLYQFKFVPDGLMLEKRFALYYEGKPVWDYDLRISNNRFFIYFKKNIVCFKKINSNII